MAYNHGVRVLEKASAVSAPITSTSGLQVVIGTAPVNLADNPYGCVNTPILVNSFEEAAAAVGYCDDFADYSICESIDATFRVAGTGPVVLINVLDPDTHYAAVAAASVAVTNGQAKIETKGILADKLVVVSGEDTLVKDTDYIVSFDADGYCIITFIASVTGNVTVSGRKIDPSAVTAASIIGGVNAQTGAESGLEVIRQVFPKLGVVPALIIAPGFSKNANVAAAIAAKCEGLNGVFTCECIVDLDSSTSGAKKYSDVAAKKEAAGLASPHMDIVWPCAKIGSKIYHGSAIKGAYTQYTDAQNDNVPYISPSNIAIDIDSICTEAGAEIILDEQQANIVNGFGVSTFNNFAGWKLWGNRTAAYPENTDVKDTWFCCRRFFSWWAKSFILAYHDRVDSPTNFRLIEAIVDDENVRGNALVAQGKCAGAYIEFREEENPVDSITGGQLTFAQHLAPFTPAEDILNTLEFDPELLYAALEGGE